MKHRPGIVQGDCTLGTDHGPFLPGFEHLGNAEINQNHTIQLVDHDVRWFDIPKMMGSG